MKKFLKILFLCNILGDHDWTSKAQEGIKPNPPKTSNVNVILADFGEYAKMYCKRCGKVSGLSL